MKLLYNSLFGIILLVFSIILVIPAIQFLFSLKDISLKNDLNKLTNTINNLKPFEYKEVILNFKNNEVLLYNPIHHGQFLNKMPLNYKAWKDYFSYSCDDEINYKDENGQIYLYLDNPQFKCFYNFNGISIKKEAINLLKGSFSNECLLGSSLNLYSELFVDNYLIYRAINVLSNSICLGTDFYIKYKLARMAPSFFKGSFGYTATLVEASKKANSIGKDELKEIFSKLSKDVYKKVFQKILESFYKAILKITFRAFSTTSTVSFIPLVGQILDLGLTIWTIKDITELISELKDRLEKLNSLKRAFLGFFDKETLEYKLKFFKLDDFAALNTYQNYLIAGKVKNNNVVEAEFNKKLDDSIVYVTGYTTLIFPQYYENAFQIKQHFDNKVYVVKLPVSNDKYVVFLLNEKEFKKLLPYLNLIKDKKYLELSNSYVIDLSHRDNKLEAYLNFKLFEEDKKSEFDLFLPYLTIYLPGFKIKNEEKIKKLMGNYEKTYLYLGFVVFDNSTLLNKKFKFLEDVFKKCYNEKSSVSKSIYNYYLSIYDDYKFLALYNFFKTFSYFYLTNNNKSCEFLLNKVAKKAKNLKEIKELLQSYLKKSKNLNKNNINNLEKALYFLAKINDFCEGVFVNKQIFDLIRDSEDASSLFNPLISYYSKLKCNSNLDNYFKAFYLSNVKSKSNKVFLEEFYSYLKFSKEFDSFFLRPLDKNTIEELLDSLEKLIRNPDKNSLEFRDRLILNSYFGKEFEDLVLKNQKLFENLNLH